jgi:hypothetical protein
LHLEQELLERNRLMGNSHVLKPHASFGVMDFVWRLLAALVLVMATYNPTGHSYVHWVRDAISEKGMLAAHFFVGVLLLVGWTIFLVATRRSLGTLGTVLGAALIGTGVWMLSQIGLIHAGSARAITWLALISLAILLAIGLSWSHIWRRLSGQLEVDDSNN